MTPYDNHHSNGGVGRQKPPRPRVTRDRPTTPDDAHDRPVSPTNETRSVAAFRGHLSAEPDALGARVEFVVVASGTRQAQELLERQAMAVRRALRWFAEHPASNEGPPS
ncbi:hypothetical protein [Rhizocola hellebori]|uniref:hypothetical protein n=1 Tax=Rhizocola hellebori TaxID=1392758 RepID=UPI001940DA4B|nr:hypothetical protein [Rhizocola hellebori]